MLWLVPWLEVLGVLAIVFAAGNGIGFALSWLSVRLGKRKARVAAPRPEPVAAVEPAMGHVEPTPDTTEVQPAEALATLEPEPEPMLEPEPIVVVPPPEPATASPAAPALVAVSHSKLATTPFYANNPFGVVSIVRPNQPPDQPSS